MLLRQIKYFVTVVDTGSFTEAAEECFISQSAISQQILSLEKEIGVQLLQRSTRRFTLTEAGKYLYSNGKKLLGEIEKLKNGTLAAAEASGGRLTLGYLNGYEGERLYKAVALFKQQNADVNLQITSGSHDELAELLASGKADLVLNLQRHVVAEPYAQQLAVSLPCFIEISSVYGGFGGSRAELGDLKDIPCIFVAGEKEQAAEAAFYSKVLGIKHELLFARSMEEAHLMAAAGNGFAFTAKNKASAAAGDGVRLLALYNNGRRVHKDYYFFWKKDNGNRYIRSFIDIALKAFGTSGKNL